MNGNPSVLERAMAGTVSGLRGFPAWVPLIASFGSLGKAIMISWLLFSYPGALESALSSRGINPTITIPILFSWIWIASGLLALAIYLRRQHGTWNGPAKVNP